MSNYEDMTDEEFNTILKEIVDENPASTLLSIPGVYEVLSEHFNNEVLSRFDGTDPGPKDSNRFVECCECREEIDKKKQGYGHNKDGYFCLECWAEMHEVGKVFV